MKPKLKARHNGTVIPRAGLTIPDSGELPTADAEYAGQMRYSDGLLVACVPSGAGYAWVDVAGYAAQSATIASGAVTVSGPHITLLTVDTEAAAASDDLATISGGTVGQVLTLNQTNDARNVTFKDNTDNLRLAGDFTGGEAADTITVVYTGSVWLEVARSNNA